MSADHLEQDTSHSGPIAWMAANSVAANLLMLVLLVGGAIMVFQVKQEVFPEVTLDMVTVTVPYPGASPEEVEQGVILAVEEAVRGIEGVKEVRATASEGRGVVRAELLTDADDDQALNDIKSAVDRITSFPQDTERPIVSLATNRRQVISAVVYGDLEEEGLKSLSERMRSDLLQSPGITIVEVSGLPAPEISIEVTQENLRKYGLTMPQIAAIVRNASIELPGGSVRTDKGEILIRTTERRDRGEEFQDIAVINRPDGTRVTLGQIATVVDGFREDDREAYFDGQRAVLVQVFRIGDQTPIAIAESVKQYLDELRPQLPEGVHVKVWEDQSEIYRDRISLLVKNALLGFLLVLLILGIFLQPRLAFWVTMGILISFMGAFLFMGPLDVSVNMISLFAFILALGIVVDDAIVVGEAAYAQRREGRSLLDASIAGAREVGRPVVFAVLTTCFAFSPLLFVPGMMGKFFKNIPMIVIPILLISLVESLFILPAHVTHAGEPSEDDTGPLAWFSKKQQRLSNAIENALESGYRPFAEKMLSYRYVTLAAALGLLIITGGLVRGGIIKFIFFPKIEGDESTVTVEMPFGTDVDRTREVGRQLVEAAQSLLEEGEGTEISEGIFMSVGVARAGGGPDQEQQTGGHIVQTRIRFVGPEKRETEVRDFTQTWREEVGPIVGADSVRFEFNIGPSAGAAISMELQHENIEVLRDAAEDLAGQMRDYDGVFDVNDGFQRGKEQLDVTLKPRARSLGVDETELARQIRGTYFGAEAERQQRGRDELRIYVRRPMSERDSEYHIENLLIRTPEGGEIPLREAAFVERGRSPTSIERERARRTVEVTGDVNPKVTTANEVVANMQKEVLPQLMERYPGLTYELGGEQEEQRESLSALVTNLALAMLAIFALLAVAFRSYIQPIVVMVAIPFGIVGAIGGHLLMGYDLSLISVMGIVALSGVVVNDSLVLIAAVNDFRRDEGYSVSDALVAGGVRRFRPILLTSLTTFFGLTPMILETSVQARFLIPMAISLGFGVLFVTVIALVIVPATYMAVEDVKRLLMKAWRWYRDLDEAPDAA